MQEGPQFVHGEAKQAAPKALSHLVELRKKRAAMAKAKRKGHTVKGLDQFASKQARGRGGDATRSSKLEPYAYLKLNPKLTKEKTRAKSLSSIERVVTKAKQGIAKGQKAKRLFEKRSKKGKAKGRKKGK